jgi:hypothetical protein
MTDANETAPIVVNPSPAADQLAAGFRTLLLLVTVITALSSLASKRDLAGFILYVQSSDFLQAVSVIGAIGTFVWGQWKTRHRAKQLAAVAADPRVPDAVATIKAPAA